MGKLTRLELYNFKSYRGKQTLLFGDSYFTSIIGPNGSGKSNSMDAISFVLGLKSSQLRSGTVKDLVYRGRVLKTSKINDDGSAANPNGRSNGDAAEDEGEELDMSQSRGDPKTAYVMAIYEDDAGEEQRWKRSITAAGQSQYYINDKVVTAKEYQAAMEAENILVKARNFLVFQGDVEQIASQSPEQLTHLIEQISGSLEYKEEFERLQKERDEAAEEASYALTRRRNVGGELKQYQEQKKEAEHYQDKSDERDQAIVTQHLWRLFRFQHQLDASTTMIQEHQENLKEYRRGVEKYERALQEARADEAKVKKEVAKVDKTIAVKNKDITTEQDKNLEGTNTALKELNARIEESRKKAAQISKERDGNAKDHASLEKQFAQVEKAQSDFEVQWQEKIQKQGKKQLSDTDLKDYRQLRAKLNSKVADDQAQLDGFMQQHRTDTSTGNNLRNKVVNLEEQLKKLEGEMTEMSERRDSFKSQAKKHSTQIEAKNKQLHQLSYNREQSNRIRRGETEKLEAMLKDIDEADDGRNQNRKDAKAREIVNDMKRAFPDRIKGRIGDLCKPKQKRYSDAVGIALGREFDSVVVDSEATGRECIQYLKSHAAGTMTFIPLDNIKYSSVSSELKNISKARLTIDAIDFDASLERAMAYACGNSIICDDLPTAKNIIYGKGGEKGHQVKAVTLDGTLIHKNGSMTGGRGTNKEHKRHFDDAALERLKAAAQEKRAKIADMPQYDRSSSEEEQLKSDLNILNQNLRFAQGQESTFEQNLTSKKKEFDHVKKNLKDMRSKHADIERNLEALKGKIEEFQDAIYKVQDKIFADFCKRTGYEDIRAYEELQGSLQHEAMERRNEFSTQKQTIKKRLEWSKEQLAAQDKRIKNFQTTIDSCETQLQELEEKKEASEVKIERLEAEIVVLEDRRHALAEKLASKAEKAKTASRELANRSKEIEERSRAIAVLEGDVFRCRSQRHALLRHCKLNQIKLPLAEGSRKLESLPADDAAEPDPDAMDVDADEGDTEIPDAANDHGIIVDFDELDEDYRDPENDELEGTLDEQINQLNADLEKLNPNMRAIDRLDGVETRFRSIEDNYNQAQRTARAARDAFESVRSKRTEIFNKAYSHISSRIDPIYRDLTRSAEVPLGGYASLDIEESDAPYLSGIKFHATPPLKRFREMEHLSGGEKTMAAMALLFSIHSYQPSPFFVLDEVDAALDNANVEKIRNYIQEKAGPGMQFVVISLKTGLFQGSESLVGVFRDQEANSSKTLTLDLRKYVE